MAYFEPYIDEDGIHIPTYEDMLDMLKTKYIEIFGADVNLSESSKDYQLLSLYAKCWDDLTALVVDDYNSRDPDYASGNSLDLLLANYSMSRRQATYSTATLTLTGEAGAEIPAGTKMIDKAGVLWSMDAACTLDANGSGTAAATCDTAGAIMAPANTINGLYDMPPGLTSVTNAEAAETGSNTESDADVRNRRRLMIVAVNNGSYDALSRALIEMDGVQKSNVVVNDTSTTDANGLPPHSICGIVLGGEIADMKLPDVVL